MVYAIYAFVKLLWASIAHISEHLDANSITYMPDLHGLVVQGPTLSELEPLLVDERNTLDGDESSLNA